MEECLRFECAACGSEEIRYHILVTPQEKIVFDYICEYCLGEFREMYGLKYNSYDIIKLNREKDNETRR